MKRKILLNIVGARPQIIKAAAIRRELRENYSHAIREIFVHSGQHYDDSMSGNFFLELGMAEPDFNLRTGSGSHAVQTGSILKGLEELVGEILPDAAVVYGDTNTTLAASITLAKCQVPVIHIEAGMRSFRRDMPEEINRVVCDHLSTLLFTPTDNGLQNLSTEGLPAGNLPPFSPVNPGVFLCGDIMLDNALYYASSPEGKSMILEKHGLKGKDFFLVTIHRDFNTDSLTRLLNILTAVHQVVRDSGMKAVIPLHPRTSKVLSENMDHPVIRGIHDQQEILLLPPASYLDTLRLESHCRMIMTDSGGVQKEAHFFQKPCVVFRDETEWVELVDNGTAILADDDPWRISQAFLRLQKGDFTYPPFYGDGRASAFICRKIHEFLFP